MTLRRKLNAEEQSEVEKQEQKAKTAYKQRESVARFKTTFCVDGLQSKLPLPFPCMVPEVPSFRALSHDFPHQEPFCSDLCRAINRSPDQVGSTQAGPA